MWFSRFLVGGLALAALVSCTKSKDPNAPPEPLAEKGKRVYANNCVVCHNANPKLDGPVGPAVAGSSKVLLIKRVLEGTYPEGYKPKRATGVMPPMPHLKDDIDVLEAYLAN